MLIIGFVIDMFVYAFSFLTLTPVLECAKVDGDGNTTWEICSRDMACASKNYRIDQDAADTISNFVTEIEPSMICDDNFSFKSSMFGTTMMFSFLLGSVFITPLGDVYGRKKMNFAVTVMQTIGLNGITLCLAVDGWANYYVLLALIFLTGLGTATHYNICMIYAAEFTTQKYVKLYTSIGLFFSNSMMVVLGIYFYFVKSILPGMYFLCAIHLYGLLLCLYLPESPYFAYATGQMEVFKHSMLKIARFNGAKLDVDSLMRDYSDEKKDGGYKEPSKTYGEHDVSRSSDLLLPKDESRIRDSAMASGISAKSIKASQIEARE